jgi:hypothetical protein
MRYQQNILYSTDFTRLRTQNEKKVQEIRHYESIARNSFSAAMVLEELLLKNFRLELINQSNFFHSNIRNNIKIFRNLYDVTHSYLGMMSFTF